MKLRAPVGPCSLALFFLFASTAVAQSAPPKPAEPAPQPSTDSTAAPPPVEATPIAPLSPMQPPETSVTPPTVDTTSVPPTQEAVAPIAAPAKRKFIFSAALGYTAGGSVKHPEITGKNFSGEMLELGFGAELATGLQLSMAFTSFMTKLERQGSTDRFANVSAAHGGSGLQPLASCSDCGTTGGSGGLMVKTPLHVHTLGPRLDYLPFGATGPFVGVTAGAAMMQDLSFKGGVAGAARVGYEYRPFEAFGVSLEAGAHAQVYSEAYAALPYAALQISLLSDPFVYRSTVTRGEQARSTPSETPRLVRF